MREPWRAAWRYVGAGTFTLAGLTVAGALLGLYLDRRFGTGPWLTFVGTLGGMVAGFYEVVTVLRRTGSAG